MHRGFIVLWRKFTETSFYGDHYATRIAIHLLLMSNHQEKKIMFAGQEITILRGQLIIGRFSLADILKINASTVRNKLLLLKKVGFLDIKSNNKFSIVTICNYNEYQNITIPKGQQKGQPEDSQRTARGHKQQYNH